MPATNTSSLDPVRERHTGARGAADRPSLPKLIRREWNDLRQDRPGQRFCNHNKRLHRPEYKKLRILALLVGPLLAVAGVVMLFVPGPGMLFVLFGLALLGGQSVKLAGLLDRGEPPVRRLFARLRDRWKKLRPRP